MKTIKIGLEYRKVFEVMTPKRVKVMVLGLMDAAEGKFAKGITRDTLPTFMELRAKLMEESEDGERCEGRNVTRPDVLERKEEDEGFEKVFKAYEDERVSRHEKVMALRNENDAVIKAENDACDKEAKAIGDERDGLEREYRALAKRLRACESGDVDEDERIRCKKKFRALERRRMALHGRGRALDERRKALIERSVDFLADSAANLQGECIALEEEVALLDEIRMAFKQVNYEEYIKRMPEITGERLKGVSFANREYEIIGSKLNDRESLKGTELDCLPPTEDVHAAKAKETKTGGINFPPDVWKVIDENWEALKDAVYRVKAKKENLDDIPLPVDAWEVLDKYLDELSELFHL